MKYLVAFGKFWYDVIIGDDWVIAVGVVLSLAVAAELAHHRLAASLWLPLAAVSVLTLSLWRAVRGSSPHT